MKIPFHSLRFEICDGENSIADKERIIFWFNVYLMLIIIEQSDYQGGSGFLFFNCLMMEVGSYRLDGWKIQNWRLRRTNHGGVW